MAVYHDVKIPTADEAIRAYIKRVDSSLGAKPPAGWVETYGDVGSTNLFNTTRPLSCVIGPCGPTNGPRRFEDFGSREVTMRNRDFNVEARARLYDLTSDQYSFGRWCKNAEEMSTAEAQYRSSQIAYLLESGESVECYDGWGFFSANHKAHPDHPDSGVFSNYQDIPKSVLITKNVIEEQTEMAQVKDPNGALLGIAPDTILVSAVLYPHVADQFRTLNVVKVSEFKNIHDWYLVDSERVKTLIPWLALRCYDRQTPEDRYLQNKAHSNSTREVCVTTHIWYTFGLFYPHAIRKIKGMP
ncbi:MAG: Mu-like prophage major head subunit gpT family protein [Polyangiaceae bacterium]|nr:Mu-like prophage major head subunit gpT family protein [Polyangiaceae bacterium]